MVDQDPFLGFADHLWSNLQIQKCHNFSEWGAKFTFDPSEDIMAFKLASAFVSQEENVGAALAIPELELAIRVYGVFGCSNTYDNLVVTVL